MAFIPKYILVLFAIIVIDYSAAIWMEKLHGKARKRLLLISLFANVGILAFFKYFGFANQTLIDFFALFGKEFKYYDLGIILPIGLSFHTFQSMSYTIEVYRGQQKAEKHLGYFANYVLFFPQMVAGPIERYATLGEELRKTQTLNYQNLSAGFRLHSKFMPTFLDIHSLHKEAQGSLAFT
jgi:D-alanyl-lipoteichoic acid acyltransferase DltB (MBOAT superfamily)